MRRIVLPFLTINGGPVIAIFRDYLVTQARAAGEDDEDFVGIAELAARIGISLMLTPESHFTLDTDDQRPTTNDEHSPANTCSPKKNIPLA